MIKTEKTNREEAVDTMILNNPKYQELISILTSPEHKEKEWDNEIEKELIELLGKEKRNKTTTESQKLYNKRWEIWVKLSMAALMEAMGEQTGKLVSSAMGGSSLISTTTNIVPEKEDISHIVIIKDNIVELINYLKNTIENSSNVVIYKDNRIDRLINVETSENQKEAERIQEKIHNYEPIFIFDTEKEKNLHLLLRDIIDIEVNQSPSSDTLHQPEAERQIQSD